MPETPNVDLHWPAIQQHVCAVCLDQRNDGSCGLPKNRICTLRRALPLVCDVLHAVDSPRMDDYVDAVERNICTRCPDQDASGRCEYREKAACALYAYLPRVLDAVDSIGSADVA
jgi:hypothetical protein